MARSSSPGSWSRLLLAAAVGAMAVAIAACGGDNKDNGLKKQELVRRANAICKPHFDRISASAQKVLAGGRLPTPRQFRQLVNGTVIPELAAQNGELHRLKPADDVKSAYERWLADADAAVAKLRQKPRLLPNAANFRTVNGEATKLGLSRQCYIGPS